MADKRAGQLEMWCRETDGFESRALRSSNPRPRLELRGLFHALRSRIDLPF